MINNTDKTFFKIYLTVSLILTLVNFIDYTWEFTPKSTLNHLTTILGYVAFFGYAFDKKIINQQFWKLFAFVFVIWEVGCYTVLYQSDLSYKLFLILVLSVKYWCVIFYPFETLEVDLDKKNSFLKKKREIIDKLLPVIKMLYHLANIGMLMFLIVMAIVAYTEGFTRDNVPFLLYFIFISWPYFILGKVGFNRAWQIQLLCMIAGFLLISTVLV